MPSTPAPVSNDRPITLLHLSDPQFGKNHRFAQRDLSGWDAPFETLLARLTEDLQILRKEHSLTPDLLVVTGDLAEWGLRSEFEDALKFLRGLCEFLELPPSRIAIIPGNHDINWKLCQSYFDECEGNELSPSAPYWPKWHPYTRFFNDFYGDTPGVQFTEEIPWSFFAFDDLKVVVAGLNSTMRESHLKKDHYGWVGERQLSWFRDKLEQYRQDGWLRIGAVHHNYRRGAENDDENLRDAVDLKRVLEQSLNLLLHGHTHDGKRDWIHPGLPVLSTGSAALNPKQRPPEVPNQYQIVQIWKDRFCRWTRGFAPDEKRWIGDNRASGDGSQWWDEQKAGFRDVSGAFIVQALSQEIHLPFIPHRSDRDDFLSRVEAVCRLGEPEAEIERLPGTGSFGDYLRVTRQRGNIIETFPVGAVEHGFTQESLPAFLAEVDSRYRRADSGLVSVLVYGGEPVSDELVREATSRRIRLQSFVEYQGLIDFRTYLIGQTAKLAADPVYPPRLYVPQRMRTVSLLGQREEETEDALAQVQDWLASPHGRFLVLLGDFGTGKTFLLQELARRMGEAEAGLVPILLQMRSLEKGRSLDALLAQHFAQEKMEGFSPARFRYMLEHGRIALLFDGFDELALRVTYGKAADHFETLLQAANGNAKVVLTSRRQHFLSRVPGQDCSRREGGVPLRAPARDPAALQPGADPPLPSQLLRGRRAEGRGPAGLD